MGVSRLSKDQVSAICASLDADVDELVGRPLSGAATPYVWLDATYVKCRLSSSAGAAQKLSLNCISGVFTQSYYSLLVMSQSHLIALQAIRPLWPIRPKAVKTCESLAVKGTKRILLRKELWWVWEVIYCILQQGRLSSGAFVRAE